ncbi:MAG: hypothetical protein JWO12_2442, partial [Frankiales bacterium]|nr:hypothetical protein [Frankiales bacterium]
MDSNHTGQARTQRRSRAGVLLTLALA